jgi:hypothetical protein
MGFRLLLLMFAGVILGGLGTAYGAMVGSLVVGLVTELSVLWFSTELKFVWALVVLILVLLVRPQGLLGRAREDRLMGQPWTRRSDPRQGLRRASARPPPSTRCRHRPQRALRLHRPAELRAGRLHARRRLRPRHQRVDLGPVAVGGLLVGLLAASCSRCCSAPDPAAAGRLPRHHDHRRGRDPAVRLPLGPARDEHRRPVRHPEPGRRPRVRVLRAQPDPRRGPTARAADLHANTRCGCARRLGLVALSPRCSSGP